MNRNLEIATREFDQSKLVLAQIQVDNLLNLLKGNPYENYLCGKLYGIRYELQRQMGLLTNTNNSIKIEE
jgi:hypothetical protein